MIKIFIVCSGLGNVGRGFESFAQECFEALSQQADLDITLFKGGGKSSDCQISIPNLRRNSWIASLLGKQTGRGSYFIEQVSFTLNLLPYIQYQQPDVIYFSDGAVGNVLWHWRRLTRQRYKLLFSNGAPFSPPFPYWDHVQQLTPTHLQLALEKGESPEKHSLVPYGIQIDSKFEMLSSTEKNALRCRLELPEDVPIILSVAAINKSHKRVDYLIREIAQLPEPQPFLLVLGQKDVESPEVVQLAHHLLKPNQFQIRTVPSYEVALYYQIADIFVLASLDEGFGRVFLEAMSYGLPCLAHDYEIAHFVLEDKGYFANFKSPGNLAKLVGYALNQNNENAKQYRHQSVYERFSWEKLRPAYINMIQSLSY